jgi:hypothetical protein
MNILKDKGLRVSNQDTRATGPLVLTAEQAAASSPAEGLGGTRIGTAMRAPALVPGSPEAAAAAAAERTLSPLENYLRSDLQFKTPEAYRSLNLDINSFWSFNGIGTFDPAPGVAEGMRANQSMRMFWIQGYYDLNTPAYAGARELRAGGAHRRARVGNDGARSTHRLRDRRNEAVAERRLANVDPLAALALQSLFESDHRNHHPAARKLPRGEVSESDGRNLGHVVARPHHAVM